MTATSFKFPGTVSNDASSGTVAWTGTGNVAADDGTNAAYSTSTGTSTSQYLKCLNFGFTSTDIPSGATIDGIELVYQRSEGSSTDNVETKALRIVKGGTISSTNKAIAGEWPTTATNETIGGGATELWGETWVDTDIAGNTNFGIAIQAGTIGSGTTPDGFIDYVKMRVHYTASSGRTTSLAATEEEDTLSAAAAVKLTASFGRTEDEDVLVGAAKVRLTASAAVTEEDDALSSSASSKIRSSVAVTEEDDTLVGAAKVRVAATLAVTEENDTLVAASAVKLSASAAMTEEDDSLVASATTGSAPIASSLAATEQDDTLVAAGAVKLSSSVSVTEENDSLVAASAVKLTSSAALTEENDSLVSSASLKLTASAAITEENDTLAASSKVGVSMFLGRMKFPTDISAVTAWYNARRKDSITESSNRVSAWNDLTGNGLHLLNGGSNQPLYVYQSPINSLPAIRFKDTGTRTWLQCADSVLLNIGTGMRAYAVFHRIQADGAGFDTIVGKYNTASGNNREWRMCADSTNFNFVTTVDGTFTTNTQTIAPDAIANNTTYLGRVAYDGVTQYSSINGGSSNTNNAAIFDGVAPLEVGAINSGGTQGFDGYISEIVIAMNNISAEDELALMQYLSVANQLGLSLSKRAIEEDDTLVAQASGKLNSSVNVTEENDSVTSAGAVKVSSSANVTEEDDNMAGSQMTSGGGVVSNIIHYLRRAYRRYVV